MSSQQTLHFFMEKARKAEENRNKLNEVKTVLNKPEKSNSIISITSSPENSMNELMHFENEAKGGGNSDDTDIIKNVLDFTGSDDERTSDFNFKIDQTEKQEETPKKKLSLKKLRRNVIRDSESDDSTKKSSPVKKSPHFSSPNKSDHKMSPRVEKEQERSVNKKEFKPDLRVNLKPLGFDESLSEWIEGVKRKPVMTKVVVKKRLF